MMRAIRLLALLCLGACSNAGSMTAQPAQVVPQLQYRNNSTNMPGYVSPCAGGQPQMQYNCSGVNGR